MAEKTLPVEAFARNGLEATYFDDSGSTPLAQRLVDGTLTTGDQYLFQNSESTILHVKNGNTSADVVVETTAQVGGFAVADLTVNVPANEERFIGPFSRNVFGDTVKFAIDDVSNVEVAVLRM